jgi:hypothetical protein
MRHRQQGITFIGLLFIVILVALPVYAVIRLVPVYINYMAVSRNLESLRSEFKGSPDPGGIRRSLERHWQIDDVTGLEAKDVAVTKEDGVVIAHAAYEDKVSFLGNISLLVTFEKSVRIE